MSSVLGLKIVRISQGYTDLYEINGNKSWTKDIRDIRKDLGYIENLDGSSAVLMLINTVNGHFLTVASPIGGRSADCISAWIYIPAAVAVTGKQLADIVEATKKGILADEWHGEELDKLFSRTYEQGSAVELLKSGNEERTKCAFRYYGCGVKYTLAELLENMLQPYYTEYKSIFLLDNESNLRCSSCADLTNHKVYNMQIVDAPVDENGFIPYLYDKPFVDRRCVFEGDVIPVVWKKDGYKSIEIVTRVMSDGRNEVLKPTFSQYRRLIPYTSVVVRDDLGKLVNNYTLYIGDKVVTDATVAEVSEAIINNVSIKVEAKGYSVYENKHNMSTLPVCINLTKRVCEVAVPEKKEEKNRIKSGKSKAQSVGPETPTSVKEVLDAASEDNRRSKGKLLNGRWLYLLMIIVLSFVSFGLGYGVRDKWGKKMDESTQQIVGADRLFVELNQLRSELDNLRQENSSLKEKLKHIKGKKDMHMDQKESFGEKDPEAEGGKNYESLQSAIDYLDNNTQWYKGEMEKYTHLRGLWGAMNTKNLQKVCSYSNTLGASNVYMQLHSAVMANQHKSYPQANFTAGDFITVTGYIRYLNDKGTVIVNQNDF